MEIDGQLVLPSTVNPRAQLVSHHWLTTAKISNIAIKKNFHRYWLKNRRSIIITVREQVSGRPAR